MTDTITFTTGADAVDSSASDFSCADLTTTGLITAGANISTTADVLADGEINAGTNLLAAGNVSVIGNVLGTDVLASGDVVAQGDVTASGSISAPEGSFDSIYLPQTTTNRLEITAAEPASNLTYILPDVGQNAARFAVTAPQQTPYTTNLSDNNVVYATISATFSPCGHLTFCQTTTTAQFDGQSAVFLSADTSVPLAYRPETTLFLPIFVRSDGTYGVGYVVIRANGSLDFYPRPGSTWGQVDCRIDATSFVYY